MDLDINAAVTTIGSDLGFSTSSGEGGSDGLADNAAGDGEGAGGGGDLGDASDPAGADAALGTGDAGDSGASGEGDGAAASSALSGTDGAPAPVADLPKTWNPKLADKWSTADPELKAEVAKREEDFFRGIEGYKADAAYGKNFKTVMQPWEPLLKAHNVDPVQLTHNLMMAHRTLALGREEEKTALLRQLAKDYRIDPAKAFAPEPDLPPEVRELREKVQRLESENQSVRSAQETATRQSLSSMIDKFASDPKNVHFDVLADDIAALLKGGIPTLEEAYEKAVWANPTTRAKEQARQQTERDAKVRKEAAEKAAKARAATAANARASTKVGSGTAPLGSMDDTIAGTLAAIRKRA
jgi:hypothetical protein